MLRAASASAPASAPAPDAVESDIDGDAALLPMVQRLLQGLPWHLAFPPSLEARMVAEQDAVRCRQQVQAMLMALLVYDLFLINDWMVRPEALTVALWCRLGVVTGFGLVLLMLIRRGLPARWREWLMAGTLVVVMAASGEIYRHTRSAGGAYDPFAFNLVIMAGNIALGLRFVPALVSSVLCVLVAVPFVAGSALLPPEALGIVFGLLVATMVFTSVACHRIERSARQSYLLTLQEALRAQATQRLADRYALISQTDALTGLSNRRAFDEAMQGAWLAAPLNKAVTGLLVVDVDHFKTFNDHFGHPAGDACLRQVALALGTSLRGEDRVARIGGEEFAVLLPNILPGALPMAAERLCRSIEALQLPHDGAPGRSVVTVSVGAAWVAGDDWARTAALMEAADRALYQAKRSGRNRWVMAGVSPTIAPALAQLEPADF